jgi:integrase
MPKLTSTQLDRAIKDGTPKRLSDGNGLQFTLPKKGEAYWVYRYTDIHKKRREITIGKYSQMKLPEARSEASKLKLSQTKGADPLLEKRRAEYTEINCCDALFDDWYETDLVKRVKHPNIPLRVYRKDISPVIGRIPVAKVNPLDIRKVIDEVVKSGRKTVANDTLMYMKQLFRHGIKLGLATFNPAASFTIHDAGGIEESKDRALTIDEIAKSFAVFRENISSFGYENYYSCCLFLMLGVRKSELCEAKWIEFDMDSAVWNLPKERIKTGAPISIPLPTQAVKLLHVLKVRAGFSEYVFPPRRASGKLHMGSDTLNRAITKLFGHEAGRKVQPTNKMGDLQHFSVHDIRRTFRSLAAMLRIRGEVAERCLNHKLKGVEGIYNRHDYFEERKEAHQKISDLVEPFLKINLDYF